MHRPFLETRSLGEGLDPPPSAISERGHRQRRGEWDSAHSKLSGTARLPNDVATLDASLCGLAFERMNTRVPDSRRPPGAAARSTYLCCFIRVHSPPSWGSRLYMYK